MSNVAPGLLYTKDDEWLRLEGDEAVIGISDYAQDSLSDIVYLELPKLAPALIRVMSLAPSNRSRLLPICLHRSLARLRR